MDGKLIGLVTGLCLVAFLGSALFVLGRAQWNDRGSGLRSALLILGTIAAAKLAALPFVHPFAGDVEEYRIWAQQIADSGPAHAYPGYLLDYPPGYLYVLWPIGAIANHFGASGQILRMMIESPPLLADFLLAAVVFVFVRSTTESKAPAIFAMLLVALNPALLYDTFIWGQTDSVMALLVVMSIVAVLRSFYGLAWGLAALAVLVKPQGLIFIPVLAVWTLLRGRIRDWLRAALAFAVIALICIAPFQVGQPWNFIIDLYGSTAAKFHETSVNAFNLMMLIGGLRLFDSVKVAGVSYYSIGMSLVAILYLIDRVPGLA